MEFSVQGSRVHLWRTRPPSVKLITNEALNTTVDHGAELCFLHVHNSTTQFIIPMCTVSQSATLNPTLPMEIELLLEQLSDIFEEPSQLPPTRIGFDHKIPLKDDAILVNIRPYRYSIIQKNVVDKLVSEMLAQGITQYSNSQFASPTVLVRKKDGSGRLCVDYRRLNHYTIKVRFPIPLIEDLMYELGGASVFSKLDLRIPSVENG